MLDHHGGTVVSEDGTLLSGFSPVDLSRWCSVRGCLEDNVTIWSLLASPKRYREFQIPNVIDIRFYSKISKPHYELC